MGRSGNVIAMSKKLVVGAGAALPLLLVIIDTAWPQAAAPESQPGILQPDQQMAAPQGGQPSPPEEKPGLVKEIGKLFEKPFSIFPPLKSGGETVDDLNARTKDAGDALSRMAKPSSMVTGRVVCPVSTNGAADCKLGADKLCQSKGYSEGKSLATDSAETCSPKVLIPGRARKPEDCRTDNFVTRALCQ